MDSSRPRWYDLDEQPTTMEEANRLLSSDARRIGFDLVETAEGSYRVSTVFLVLDHRLLGDGPPLLYETMVFGPDDGIVTLPDEEIQVRVSTRKQAQAAHEEVLTYVRLMVGPAVEEPNYDPQNRSKDD